MARTRSIKEISNIKVLHSADCSVFILIIYKHYCKSSNLIEAQLNVADYRRKLALYFINLFKLSMVSFHFILSSLVMEAPSLLAYMKISKVITIKIYCTVYIILNT